MLPQKSQRDDEEEEEEAYVWTLLKWNQPSNNPHGTN